MVNLNIDIGVPRAIEELGAKEIRNNLEYLYDNSGAQSINELSDGKFDGSSLFLGQYSGVNDDGTSNSNVGVGSTSLRNNTSGYQNTAVGY